ncbi:MAG: J domain-containing protein [Lysobacterales bacterium]
MTAPDFDKIFRTLGVDSSASWEEITQAYRRKVQAAHPDRAGGNPRIVKIAQAKFDEIQSAFEELKRYRKIFGDLPSDMLDSSNRSGRHRATGPAAPTPPSAKTEEPAEPLEPAVPILPDNATPFKNRWWLAGVAIVAASVIWFTPGPKPPVYQSPAATADESLYMDGSQTLVGLARTDLLQRFGPPDSSDDTIWRYGDAKLTFDDGRVQSVYDPDDHLEQINQRANPTQAALTVGISKLEVLDLLNAPTTATENVWTYGRSEIWFSDGNFVSGWISSPPKPLPVQQDRVGRRPGSAAP